jgi:N-carbamoyl-L-amino-acid hydrolase
MPATRGLLPRLNELAQIGANDGGITRPLFTKPDFEARKLFVTWAHGSGFALAQDVVGNIFARRPGRRTSERRRPILLGSHLDTVQGGGAYDGAYGVVAALCVLDALDAAGTETEHPIEAVAWAGEEGSRFPLGCLGSGVYAGTNALADVERLVSDDGESFVTARDSSSGLLRGIEPRGVFPVPAAYLELHIEQGPLLEQATESLGVVTAIAGARRLRVEIVGARGHAGTVPMADRKDALCAAAEIVLAMESAAREIGDCVATVGRLDVEPNETNVIPGVVTFRIDLRSVDDARLERLDLVLQSVCDSVAKRRGVTASLSSLERRNAVPMDARLRTIVHAAIVAAGGKAIDVPSGAGHDAMCLAAISPTAMLFVPSAGGHSHAQNELTTPTDLERGLAMLTRATLDIDRALAKDLA